MKVNFRHAGRIIGLIAGLCLLIVLFRNLSMNIKFEKRLKSIEQEQQTINYKLDGLDEIERQVAGLSDELKSLKLLKNSQEGKDDSNEPIVATTTNFDASLFANPYIGDSSSPLVMMMFMDYQCSPCRQFYKKSFSKLKTEYVDTKKAKLVFRDFPLSSNLNSSKAARFAHCAGEQGLYWEAFRALFEQSENVDFAKFSDIASSIKNLQITKFNNCFDDPDRYSSEIKKENEKARELGVKGAPAIFVGIPIVNSTEISGVLIRGAQPFQVIKHQVENLLFKRRTSNN